MAEVVVQVASEPFPFAERGQFGVASAGQFQRLLGGLQFRDQFSAFAAGDDQFAQE